MVEADLTIVHCDGSLAVVDKPAGLLAVPGRGPDKEDSVETRFKRLFPDCPVQPAVHRLDMDTSGLMVLARTREAQRRLQALFASRQVEKVYAAVVEGEVAEAGGRIELAFRLDPEDRPRQVYDPVHGKLGITLWQRLAVAEGRSWIRFVPLTGRTHQLRLHAAHPLGLGCAIVGDRLYGHRRPGERMLLHAYGLRFLHPDDGRPLSFVSAPPFFWPETV